MIIWFMIFFFHPSFFSFIFFPFHLNSKDAEDDEEGTTDEDDVSNWSERRQQRLNHQLQAGSSADYSD